MNTVKSKDVNGVKFKKMTQVAQIRALLLGELNGQANS
jgi:hypothetical protein